MENKQREVKCIVQDKRTEAGFKPSDSGVHILKLQYLSFWIQGPRWYPRAIFEEK